MKKIFLIAVVSTMTFLFAADMREDAILKRIQHLGSVCTSADCGLKTSGPGWKVSTSMFAAPVRVTDASGRDGKTVYELLAQLVMLLEWLAHQNLLIHRVGEIDLIKVWQL